ncbi:MAG: peptidylprolyl isomerase [Flavobacteriaceae bacterium]
MMRTNVKNLSFVLLLIAIACQSPPPNKKTSSSTPESSSTKQEVQDTSDALPEGIDKNSEAEKKPFLLNDKNAIPFFFNYEKENPEDKVRITTRFGTIDIRLYKNTPYHRANFIYLTKKNYFNGTTFHRVVPGFIIQGGNSDRFETSKKRGEIGKYLLPPDTRKGYKHHRGVLSMPSSEIENPHKLASPYEFFIVQQTPGAYHLDGSYTIFGEVIAGMEVVDEINKQVIDNREAPLTNIHIEVSILNE